MNQFDIAPLISELAIARAGRHAAEQRLLPGAIGQESVDQPPAAFDDLARQTDDAGGESLELHSHDLMLLFPACLAAASRVGDVQHVIRFVVRQMDLEQLQFAVWIKPVLRASR